MRKIAIVGKTSEPMTVEIPTLDTYTAYLKDLAYSVAGGKEDSAKLIAGNILKSGEIVWQLVGGEIPMSTAEQRLRPVLESYHLTTIQLRDLWLRAGGSPEEVEKIIQKFAPSEAL